MFNLTDTLARELASALPDITVSTSHFGDATRPSVAEGPVVVISQTPAKEICLSIHIDECDEINGLVGRIYRATMQADLGRLTHLAFDRSVPIFDNSDFRIGEHILFRPDALAQAA